MAEQLTSCLSKGAEFSLSALFEADLADDRGEAAQLRLKAGRAVHYAEDTTPEGHVICEHPAGDRELLRVDADGSVHVISAA